MSALFSYINAENWNEEWEALKKLSCKRSIEDIEQDFIEYRLDKIQVLKIFYLQKGGVENTTLKDIIDKWRDKKDEDYIAYLGEYKLTHGILGEVILRKGLFALEKNLNGIPDVDDHLLQFFKKNNIDSRRLAVSIQENKAYLESMYRASYSNQPVVYELEEPSRAFHFDFFKKESEYRRVRL